MGATSEREVSHTRRPLDNECRQSGKGEEAKCPLIYKLSISPQLSHSFALSNRRSRNALSSFCFCV